MPRQFLEQVTLDMVQAELPHLAAVEIDDPRETAEAHPGGSFGGRLIGVPHES